MRSALLGVLVALAWAIPGCVGMRFIIELTPRSDDLTETTVLDDDGAGLGASAGKIALIDVTGLMIDAERRKIVSTGENPVARFAEALRKAERDSDVEAVIVRINSAGGTVAASDLMYRELKHFRAQSEKPVVVLMAGVAASGGYYLSCAGDEIIAHPTTITGSIGVVMQTFNFSEGMNRIGIHADAITSGPNKDVGNPFEPMPAEHRALLQGIINEFYENFLSVVKTNRSGLSESDIAWITDGRIVTGARAAEVGLIDGLGDLRDAFDAAKDRAGLRTARLVKYHRPMEHVGSAYAQSPVGSTQANLLELNIAAPPLSDQVGFYYLWDPAVWQR
ncbi:MAG: signal peptide peptidase SppA [Planctomycetota bacterium]|nr:signal peptide peptidase SppA [Planctomycetota bacterium]